MDGEIVTRPGERAGQHAARRRRRRRQHVDGVPAARRLGDRRRRARASRARGSPTRTAGRRSRATSSGTSRAAYVQRKYEVRLNVYNIVDKKYYIGGYNNNPNRVLPGVPRAASVTLRYAFLVTDAAHDPRGPRLPSRSRGFARASTRRGGSTATSPPATSRRRRSTTSSCPRTRSRRARSARRSSRRSRAARCSSPRRCRSRSFRRSSTATARA